MKQFILGLCLTLIISTVIIYLSHYYPRHGQHPQIQAMDSIAHSYKKMGYTADAAYLIAAFEVDLYDEGDTAEYRLYQAYMED